MVPSPSAAEHAALIDKYGLAQRVEAQPQGSSSAIHGFKGTAVQHSPSKKQACADARDTTYAYTAPPPTNRPTTLGIDQPSARVGWRCGGAVSGQASAPLHQAPPSSYKAVHPPPLAATNSGQAGWTPSPLTNRPDHRRNGNWSNSSKSDSSTRGSDKPHRNSTVGEMRSQQRAPFTPVKVLTAHSPKDALKSPVGTPTGCSPPPSRAVDPPLPDMRTETQQADASNRRECDRRGQPHGAARGQVTADHRHRPPSVKAHVFDDTKEYSTANIVFFWKSPSCLSNFTPSHFEVDGVKYNAGEQFFAAAKARLFGDDTTLRKILRATNPDSHKHLGRLVSGFDETVWKREREKRCSLVSIISSSKIRPCNNTY